MNAATFLSFAGLLALVSMSEAVIGTNRGLKVTGNNVLTYQSTERKVERIFGAYSTNTKQGFLMVAHIPKPDMNSIVKEFRLQIPRIPEQILNPILSVPESSMLLSSVEVPTINFPINDMKHMKLSTSTEVIDLTFVIPEITVNFSSRKRLTNQPLGGTIKLQYAFQQNTVKLEIKFTPVNGPDNQKVASATVKSFEPEKVTVQGYERNSAYLNLSHEKTSQQFRDIVAVGRHYLPANFTNGPIVKNFAQKLFF